MKLYHGTNGHRVKHILETGLCPRGGKKKGNWAETVTSNPKCVYLTDSYAPYFAFAASRGKEPVCAVLEIDTDRLDEENLFPDEDFLEQATRKAKDAVGGSMRARTLHYRKRQFDYDSSWMCVLADGSRTKWWKASLKYLGTCSHKGIIPPTAITRVVWWPHKQNIWMQLVWDPTITIMNQQIMGDRYRSLTAKLFAGEFNTKEEIQAQQNDAEATARHWGNPLLPQIEGWHCVDVQAPIDLRVI